MEGPADFGFGEEFFSVENGHLRAYSRHCAWPQRFQNRLKS